MTEFKKPAVDCIFFKTCYTNYKTKVEVEMSKKNSSISFSLGLLAGVVGGIIAGVLHAPKSGDETREELKETIIDLAQKHSPEVQEAKKQALESIDLVKYKLERHYRKLNHMFKSKKLLKAKELEDSEYDFN